MVCYRTPGAFSAPWEDFIGQDVQSVTITTLAYLRANNFGEEEVEDIIETSDGWLEVVLDVPEVTEEIAREWLAVVNNVQPQDVTIEAKRFCFSM